MIDNHRLTAVELDQLAAGLGDRSVVRTLRAAQASRRLLQLRLLRDAVRSGPFDGHFDLLAEVQRHAPGPVEAVLLLPHTGAWLASTLRRVRGAWPGRRPIDADLSYLGALAAVAASRAGIDIEVEVTPQDGTVLLPDLGRATVDGDAPVAVAHTGGELRVGPVPVPGEPGTDADGWRGLRLLRSEEDGLTLRVRLDDLDPFRDCHRLSATHRLGAEEAARWQRQLDEAWAILVRHHRGYAEAIAEGLTTIVPLQTERANRGMNVTSMDAFGAVSLTPPADGHGLALGLLHEFQHAKLGATLDVVPLYHRDDRPRFYAPWRDDPRPLGAALQGVYAFLGVTDFWRVQRRVLTGARARLAEAEFVRWRDRVWRTFLELESSGRFTALGLRFLDGLRATHQRWRDEPASPEAVELAGEAAEDHWTGWRLRNRRADPAEVDRLARAWHQGLSCPTAAVPTTIVPRSGRLLTHSARLDLVRLRITDPARFARLCAAPESLPSVLPEASPGDLALARGEHAAARDAYRRQILAGERDLAPWIGLTLSCRRARPDGELPDGELPDFPELCLAVHRRVTADGRAVDPLALARWLRPATHATVTSEAAPGRS